MAVLVSIPFEHVFPERLYFLDVAPFAVNRNAGEQEAFGEFAVEANFL